MKLLFENWRKYVTEEAEGCTTVDQLLEMMDQMQKGEKDAATRASERGWIKVLVKTLAGLVPLGALASGVHDVYETLKGVKDQLKTERGGLDYDSVADYPILGHLKIDPELIKVLEDDLLKQLDEMYEDEVLIHLKGDTCIEKIPSINDFIRKKIAVETEKHVVIHDKSGSGV
jgi:hypothetical protein|tara:strand:- start:488 stop:1006 length:519 start_codon:yes stop_codon:yes gene_type:complete